MGSEWGSEPGDDFKGETRSDASNNGDNDGEEREKVEYVPDYDANEDDNIYTNTMNAGIDFDQYFKIPVTISGENKPSAVKKFQDCDLDAGLLDNIINKSKCNWSKPTPIQGAAIPILQANRDIMAVAQTGSGKTGAFGIPIINKLIADGCEAESFDDGPVCPEALIVAPVRELAQQIMRDLARLCRGTKLRCNYAVGGHAVRNQIDKLKDGCNILVATPGRLNDFIGKNRVSLENLKFLVLDEADRMLDEGFGSVIKDLALKVPDENERRTLMFSATFPSEVQEVAKELLQPDYLFVAVGIVGAATTTVKQTIREVEKKQRKDVLCELLEDLKDTGERTLIFAETRKEVDFLASLMAQKAGVPSTSIHGDRKQEQREEAIRTFSDGTTPILCATNVAARGLDIPKVQHVINYELPKDIDEYVHRIGRTGRCGNKGRATSFYDPEKNSALAPALVEILKNAQQEVPDFLQEAIGGNTAAAHAEADDDDDDEGW